MTLAAAFDLPTDEPGALVVVSDLAGALHPYRPTGTSPPPASPRTGTMPTTSDLDALPFALRLAYAVEDDADRGPPRTVWQLVRLYWRLDADVARLRREGDPAGVLPTLDRLRVQFRQLAQNALARHGHLLTPRCDEAGLPTAAPVLRVSRAVRSTAAALAVPAEAVL